MEVITIEHPQSFNEDDFPPLAIALGFFDGIHKGHQTVIGTAVKKAEELGVKSAVMTFDPHPSAVLGRTGGEIRYITPLPDKIRILGEMGVDYVFVIHFTKEFASLLPQAFVDQYLINIHAVHVVAGFDYTYGKFGEGTMETLQGHSRGRFTCTVVERQTLEDEKVSSTRIRATLKEGNFKDFYHLTGRRYTSPGVVVHGEKRGRKLGFPTANLEIDPEYIFPAPGVYAVRAEADGRWYDSVCNVGYKPTFHEELPDIPSVEVHLIGYKGDLYGRTIQVKWYERLRSEKKFSGLDELVKQIQADKERTAGFFAELDE